MVKQGSAFFENERKRDQMVTERIERMMAKYDKIRDLDLSMETRITDRMVCFYLYTKVMVQINLHSNIS